MKSEETSRSYRQLSGAAAASNLFVLCFPFVSAIVLRRPRRLLVSGILASGSKRTLQVASSKL